MKVWSTRSIQTIVNASPRVKQPSSDSDVWNLNLDQIESHSGRVLKKVYVSAEKLGPSTFAFEPRTVLYSKLRPYLNKVVVADEAGFATTELVPLRCNPDEVHPEYLAYFLRSDEFLRFATEVVAGAKMPRMVMNEFWNFQVPVPPLPEQRRIAAILDKADALRAKRREALAQLDNLTQSIFIEMFGDPIGVRSPWATSRLATICKKISDGTHHSPPIQATGVPYITAKHLKEYGLDFYSSPWFVSEKDHRQIYARCDPKPGDVLYIKDGATTGIAAINNYSFEFSMLSSLALLRPDNAIINSNYLCHWLNSPSVKIELIGEMAGAAIRRLTLTKIKAVSIPVPPIKLQDEFAHRLSVIEKVKKQKKQSLLEIETLFASLQYRAFRGEL